jgi:hypothetical protein
MEDKEKSVSWQPGDRGQRPPGNPWVRSAMGSDEEYVEKHGGAPPSLAALSPDITMCEHGTWVGVVDKALACPGCGSYRYKFNQGAYDAGLKAARARLARNK